MANNKPATPNQVEAAAKPKAEVKAAPAYVSKYTITELAEAAKAAFNTDKVIVLAALKAAGKESYSMEEASRIVTAFKNKEVTK